MVTLKRLNLADTDELHRRLGQRWRSASMPRSGRLYRAMCHVYIRGTILRHEEERARYLADRRAA